MTFLSLFISKSEIETYKYNNVLLVAELLNPYEVTKSVQFYGKKGS